jgi:hypothetical protein
MEDVMLFVSCVLSLVAMAPPQGADKLTSVRTYVFTETSASGQPSDDERGRLDAVREMREALSKKKGISLVDDRADATLLVEVTDREQGDEPAGSFGGKSVTRMGDTIIRLHLTSGKDEVDLKGMGQGTWGRAAKDGADRILKWIARREPHRSPDR